MAGNFRGVLIFVIFVVDLTVTKFSHPQKIMPCKSMIKGMATNIVVARPTLPSISKQHCIQLIASSILIFFYLMLFVLDMA